MTHLEILSKLKHGTLTPEEQPEAYQVIKDRLFELMELALGTTEREAGRRGVGVDD